MIARKVENDRLLAVGEAAAEAARKEQQRWLNVGDLFLTPLMKPPLHVHDPIPERAIVGMRFDVRPGYFFGVIGPRHAKQRGGKRARSSAEEYGHVVWYTDGDYGWYPESAGLLQVSLVNEAEVLRLFPNVREEVHRNLENGVFLLFTFPQMAPSRLQIKPFPIKYSKTSVSVWTAPMISLRGGSEYFGMSPLTFQWILRTPTEEQKINKKTTNISACCLLLVKGS